MRLKSVLLAAAALALAVVPAAAVAQADDPAAVQIDSFDNSLLQVMRQAKSLGVQGRFRTLEPVMARTFDLPTMTRFAVGPKWATASPGDQAALTRAFSRLAVSFFAKNFDDYSGQSFKIDPNVDTRGPDKLVRTHILSPHDKTEDLTYRMRQAAAGVHGRGEVRAPHRQLADRALVIDVDHLPAAVGGSALARKIDDLADKQLR